jgi:hypothetical protein
MSNVNHPSHYQCGEVLDSGDTEFETIVVLERLAIAKNFCLGNAIKYLSRAGRKDSVKQDLEKSVWYLRRATKFVYKRNEIMEFTSFNYINDVCKAWNMPVCLKDALEEIINLNFDNAINLICTYINNNIEDSGE